jgi:hypothetical protein
MKTRGALVITALIASLLMFSHERGLATDLDYARCSTSTGPACNDPFGSPVGDPNCLATPSGAPCVSPHACVRCDGSSTDPSHYCIATDEPGWTCTQTLDYEHSPISFLCGWKWERTCKLNVDLVCLCPDNGGTQTYECEFYECQ